MTCNKSNCLSSATSIGLEPVNREAPKRNQYVRNLTPQEQEIFNKRVKRKEEILDINNCEITKDEKNCRNQKLYNKKRPRQRFVC